MSIIVFASQTGLMYCCSRRQNFYGSTFKMWQINITKQNHTSGPLGAECGPMPQRPQQQMPHKPVPGRSSRPGGCQPLRPIVTLLSTLPDRRLGTCDPRAKCGQRDYFKMAFIRKCIT